MPGRWRGGLSVLLMTLVLAVISVSMPHAAEENGGTATGAGVSASAQNGQSVSSSDIQWFKDQMKISEKYVEHREGVLGMSWAHFFTMVFLVVFAFGALIAFFQRQRRTREILEMIRKEMADGDNG